LDVNTDGEKELLGIWVAQTEGAKFWLSMMNELKNHGLKAFRMQLKQFTLKRRYSCAACASSFGKSAKPLQKT